jgi:hypothetical protein
MDCFMESYRMLFICIKNNDFYWKQGEKFNKEHIKYLCYIMDPMFITFVMAG